MRNDKQVRELYTIYDDVGRAESVNDSFTAVQDMLKEHGLKTANDDRAERLVTAIARYIFESDNDTLDTVRLNGAHTT